MGDALLAEINRVAPPLFEMIARVAPNFDVRRLDIDYGTNLQLWHACWDHAHALVDRRKTRVENLAWLAVRLFVVLLLIKGNFVDGADTLLNCHDGRPTDRRRAFMLLWLALYQSTGPDGSTDSTPRRRAAYEVARAIYPDAAKDYDADRDALKKYQRWLDEHQPGLFRALKSPQ